MGMAAATVMVVPGARATSLRMGEPVPVADGWMRAAGHYDSGASEPTFQLVARCGAGASDVHVLHSIHLVPDQGTLWLDLPGTADRLGPRDAACKTPELALEMVVDTQVVASAPLPRRVRRATSGRAETQQEAIADPAAKNRFRLSGQKYASPVGSRSEAGVAMSLGSHFSVQLNYARTAQVPMMGYSSDNGILARLRIGF